MKTTFAPTPTTNEKQGNGKYKPLRKRKVAKKAGNSDDNFRYLTNNDLTMQFERERDPIYCAFDYLENRSLPELMGDFIKDSFFEIGKFISKVGNKR